MNILEQLFDKSTLVEEWLKAEEAKCAYPLYTSVDIRQADYKICGVDTNLFPAGFNNLCGKSIYAGVSVMKKHVQEQFGDVENIILIAEAHTRNTFYHQSLLKLIEIFKLSGYKVRPAILGLTGEYPFEIDAPDGKLEVPLISIQGGDVFVGDFKADLVVLNNDLSAEFPQLLKDVTVPITPPVGLGWHARKKSQHFAVYDTIVERFSKDTGIDPWVVSTINEVATGVNFKEELGLDDIAQKTDAVLDKIREKYREYDIKREPLVFIKNNSGTYGMGITTLKSGEDIFSINRKVRNKMTTGKSSVNIHEVFIQEGVPSDCKILGDTCEPVIYFMANQVIGGFFRAHKDKSATENLNAKGMSFANFCLSMQPTVTALNSPHHCYEETSIFTAIKASARLACLAAAQEVTEAKNGNGEECRGTKA